MAQLQINRYDRLMRRVGGIIESGSVVSEVISEVFPVVELEDTVPELLALAGWRLAWTGTERPASPGNPTAHQVFNPEDSGVIAAITGLMIQVDGNTLVTGGINTTLLGGTPVRGVFRDSRFGGARESTLTSEHIDGLSVGIAGGWNQRMVANEQMLLRDDNGIVVLAPGSGLVFQTSGNNFRMTISWFWRERPAEPSEFNI